jgi:hypothetical protein
VQDGDGDCTATPDIGAFERAAAVCAPPTPPVTPATPVTPVTPVTPAADRTKPVVTKLTVATGRASFTLSETAKVTVLVERSKPGRKSGKRCVAGRKTGARCLVWVRVRSLSRAGRRGANNVPLGKLTAGGHRVKLTATDAAGNVTVTPVRRFTVKAA